MGKLRSNLLELRKARTWTLRELAVRTGIPISTLSEYERGIRVPWNDDIPKLAEVFGTPVHFSIPVSPVKRAKK